MVEIMSVSVFVICLLFTIIISAHLQPPKQKLLIKHDEHNILADNQDKFTRILDSILNKASTEPVFAEQYAELCLYLSQQLP